MGSSRPGLASHSIAIVISIILYAASLDRAAAKMTTIVPIALADCPDAPHCVSTEAQRPEQRMAPIRYNGSAQAARERLRRIIKGLPRATIKVDTPGYLSVEVKSRFMGFIDDVEFLFDNEYPIIHFRSAARAGYYDFGVNRARMESIFLAFQASEKVAD